MFKPYRNPNLTQFNAGVIGGGITGLTTAWKLSNHPKCSRVTLYEKSSRLGGCIQTESIPVEGGKLLFESGPQSLRAKKSNLRIYNDLVSTLSIENEVRGHAKNDPRSFNRFLYYPDHLVRVPTYTPHLSLSQNIREAAYQLRHEPVFKGLVGSILREPFKAPPKPYPDDEPVAEFISRRFSPLIADNLASAMFHGIYAGDIDKISANSVLGDLRRREESHGSIILLSKKKRREQSQWASMANHLAMYNTKLSQTPGLDEFVLSTNSQTFETGMGRLIDALVAALKNSKKVDVITNADVNGISKISGGPDLMVNFVKGESRIHDRVVATNPAPDVARILSKPSDQIQPIPTDSIENLRTLNYAVSVTVVNLYYPESDINPLQGFGYLIPRSVPYEKNPERALGVVFGSGTGNEMTEDGFKDHKLGTKLTVMLGGHLWDHYKESDYPDHDQAVAMARSVVERHMGITAAPTVARSWLHRNGIPQYTVGHQARLKEISRSVRRDFNGRLSLAGNWYTGVSVMDCIEQAYLASMVSIGDLTYCDGKGNPVDLEGGIPIPPTRWVQNPPPLE